jgi:hypothetical protein
MPAKPQIPDNLRHLGCIRITFIARLYSGILFAERIL